MRATGQTSERCDEDRRARLLQALDQLTEYERVAYLRGARDGWSYQQIGDELGVSFAEVEQLTASALLKLSRALGTDASNSGARRLGDASSDR